MARLIGAGVRTCYTGPMNAPLFLVLSLSFAGVLGMPHSGAIAVQLGLSSLPADAEEESCEAQVAAITAVLNSGSTACETTADCGCYGGGMGPRSKCGGLANSDTLARLAPLQRRFRASDCYPTQHCGPWSCVPVCREGRCQNSPRGGGSAGLPL